MLSKQTPVTGQHSRAILNTGLSNSYLLDPNSAKNCRDKSYVFNDPVERSVEVGKITLLRSWQLLKFYEASLHKTACITQIDR